MKTNYGSIIKNTLLLALLSAIILVPLIGLPLNGYEVSNRLDVSFMFIAAIVGGKFVLNILLSVNTTATFIKKYFSQKNLPVDVAKAGHQNKNVLMYIALGLLAVSLLILPFIISKYYIIVAVQCMIYIMLGLGLNIVVGWAGMLDLGFVAFYAVGAYTLGLLSQHAGLGFWSVLPIAGFVTAMFGAVLGFPVLRMHGDYLAIVTLGFGEIIRLFLNNMLELTGGPNGMSVPKITFFGYEFSRSEEETTFSSLFGLEYDSTHQMIFLYLVLFAVCVLAIVFCSKLKKMPIGRAWEALREDEIACRSMGINHVAVKLSAFMLGAMFGGISGVFFAAYQGFINPTSFTFIESVLIVAIVVLGGLGSIPGVIMAAIALNVIPELFREFQDYRIIMFGLAMVIMMLWRPRGLIRIVRPRFEMNKKEAHG